MKPCVTLLVGLWLFLPTAGVRVHLSAVHVARAVQLLEDGSTQRMVAQRFGVSPSVINRLWRRYQNDDIYTRRPGQGRPRLTTPRQDQYLRVLARRNRQSTARLLRRDFHVATGVRLSDQTVRNRLHEADMRARRPATGPILTIAHRRARLEFGKSVTGDQYFSQMRVGSLCHLMTGV